MFENISWLFLCLFLPLKKSAYTAILLNSIVTKSQQVPKVVGIRDLSKRGYSQSCPNAPCMYDISLHLPYISDKLYRQKFPVPWGGIFGAKSCHQDSVKKKMCVLVVWEANLSGSSMGTHVSFIFRCYNLPSLKLTVSLHLKMDGWNTRKCPFGARPMFRGVCCLFQAGYMPYIPEKTHGQPCINAWLSIGHIIPNLFIGNGWLELTILIHFQKNGGALEFQFSTFIFPWVFLGSKGWRYLQKNGRNVKQLGPFRVVKFEPHVTHV